MPSAVQDWWNPDPEDPYWMLEDEQGQWLKNEHSQLTTSDSSKALRFPSEWHADAKRNSLTGMGWAKFRPTEHKWIKT